MNGLFYKVSGIKLVINWQNLLNIHFSKDHIVFFFKE